MSPMQLPFPARWTGKSSCNNRKEYEAQKRRQALFRALAFFYIRHFQLPVEHGPLWARGNN